LISYFTILIYINLISGPRNISTALMYSFAQRSDTRVSDEPFYACYLSKTQADHPGKKDVLNAQSSDEAIVKQELFKENIKPVLFIKNMAHHIEILDESFLTHCINVFLIRDPKQIIASYAQVIENPVMRDIGIQYEYELFEMVKNQNSIVIDSGLLLRNPESVLQQVCKKIGIEFEKQMLSWPAGPKSYDGVWAPHWYANVHKSTGFEKQPTSERALPSHLTSLYETSAVYYNKLLQHALKP
jgi:hypothetical protein